MVPSRPQAAHGKPSGGVIHKKSITDAIAFFVVRDNGAPAGCGGNKLVGSEYGELKRMGVRSQSRGLG
jgi:putative acetyltransferase